MLGLAAAFAVQACSPEAPADKSAGAGAPVVLHRVTAGGPGRFQATGTVRLRRETPLAFVSDGRIRAIEVRAGDVVRAGQMLAGLDRTAIDAAAVSADARASQATAELRRQRELNRAGWVSKARVEAAEATARAAEAERSGAQFTRRFASINAPAAGVVLARLAEPGQTLPAGTPVVILVEFGSGFVLRVPLGAGDAAGLARGQAATVRFRDGAAPAMAARIIEMAGRADEATGTFQIEFALPAHPALRSGLIADVELPRPAGAGALRIPASALFAVRADEGFVWMLDPRTGKVAARLVKLGPVSAGGVDVASGLRAGEFIVGAGVDRLIEGQSVRPAGAAR